MKSTIAIAISVLEDLRLAIKQFTGEEYNATLDLLLKATIGKHSRHIIEFFQCLQKQCNESSVCYDNRLRNLKIEQDPDFAAKCIEEIQQWLKPIEEDKQLSLHIDYSCSSQQEELIQVKSSLKREIISNIEHCVHHMAMIRMGVLMLELSIDLPADFGVAASTVRHENI